MTIFNALQLTNIVKEDVTHAVPICSWLKGTPMKWFIIVTRAFAFFPIVHVVGQLLFTGSNHD